MAAARAASLKAFAEATGIPYRTLQDYVADKRVPSADQLVLLSAQNIDLNWLLTGRLAIPLAGLDSDTEGADVAGVDPELARALTAHALVMADGLVRRAFDDGSRPPLAEQLDYAGYYLAVMLRITARLYPAVKEVSSGARKRALVLPVLEATVREISDESVLHSRRLRGPRQGSQ